MKTHFKILSGIALILSGCTTGSMVSSGGYGDDVYFTPGDNPPPVVSKAPARGSISSERSQDRAAKVVDEYFDNNADSKSQKSYSLNNEDSGLSDSLEMYDEEVMDYELDGTDEEMSYSTRIRTYIDPYMYDPYWDSYIGIGMGMGWGMGFGGYYGGYGGYYGGWNRPWSYGYGGWYDPWYSYGWGGYYDYPYYGYYGGGYYGGGYWGNGGGSWNGDRRDRFYGRQNYAGRLGGGSDAVNYGGNRAIRSGSVAGGTYGSSSSGDTRMTGRRDAVNQSSTSTRQSATRYTVDPNASTRSTRMSQPGQQGRTTRSTETLMELRRNPQGTSVRQGTSGQSATRSSSTSPQRYTPTYTRPRTNTQATYNSGTRQYTRPQSSGSLNSENRYAKPGSITGSPNRSSSSYGTSSGTTYQRRSATVSPESSGSSSGRTYSAPSRSSGSDSYSAPSRSSSSGSYSAPSSGSYGGGGGSYGGGGSSGSSSGGGGSSSGRRR